MNGIVEKIRAVSAVQVYVARFPFDTINGEISHPARAKEIESCTNARVKSEKYYAWKLLEHAILHSFGLKTDDLSLKKRSDGKWVCDECYVSLSHSENFVAVAVSGKSVGVDIEKCDPARFSCALAEKTATEKERGLLKSAENIQDEFCALWTKKEAIFKVSGEGVFWPKNIEVCNFNTLTKAVLSSDGKYFVSVASEDAQSAVFKGLGDISFADIK